jgi:hypothetical protein
MFFRIYVGDKNEYQTANILNVDVAHDLALIQIKRNLNRLFKFLIENFKSGIKFFSLGLPQDLDMAIVEGVYNGLIDMGPYKHVHLSTPINSGMSGGPTVDQEGKVVGVNVSYLMGSQNISFAVPALYLEDLLKKEPHQKLKESVRSQLYSVQEILSAAAVTESAKLLLPGWEILKPAKMLKCSSDRTFESEKYYEETFNYCYLPHAAYLGEDMMAGTYEVHFRVIQNKTLNPWQTFSLVDRIYNRDPWFRNDLTEYSDDRNLVSKFDCESSKVVNKNGVPIKVNYCMNTFVDYPHLYQMDVRLSTLSTHSSVLMAQMRFLGFTKENIQKILKSYLESVRKI